MGALVVRHHVLVHNAHNRFHARCKSMLLMEVTRYFGDGECSEHLVLFRRYRNARQSGHLILQAAPSAQGIKKGAIAIEDGTLDGIELPIHSHA